MLMSRHVSPRSIFCFGFSSTVSWRNPCSGCSGTLQSVAEQGLEQVSLFTKQDLICLNLSACSSLCVFLYHENELIEQMQDYRLLLQFRATLTRSCPGSIRSQMVSTVWSSAGGLWCVLGQVTFLTAAAQFGQGQVQSHTEESETSWFIR